MKAIILDSETTGLKDSRPVEIAYIDVSALFNKPMCIDGSRKVFEYRKLFNPLKPIEFGALAIQTDDDGNIMLTMVKE